MGGEVDRAKNNVVKISSGDNDIPIHLLKELGAHTLKKLTHLIIRIYETGKQQKYFLDVTVIPPKRKQKTKKRGDQRPVSLMSYTVKILARAITRRLENKMEEVIRVDQLDFRKERGTRDVKHVVLDTSYMKFRITRFIFE